MEAGYRDFSFGLGTLATPTGEKPQSKLWWNAGVWWGCLWDPAVAAHRIHRFDPVTQTWSSVGPNADDRPGTLVDVLWDGTRLYVVSHMFNSNGEFRLHSYTYDAATQTYSLRSGFPVLMGSGSAEALTIAKDTTGKLWITWEQSGNIMVNRSTSGETTWGTAFRLPVQGNNVNYDDISGIIAFGSQSGILWSNQNDMKMYFALHQDGDSDTTWQPREEALADAVLGKVADDHLNMALSCSTNPPCLYAVTKTSLSGAVALPQIYLLRRDTNGTWTSYVAGDQDDDHTRAIVQIDDENRKIYIIARSNAGDNAIRVKVSDLDDIYFADGSGTAFIQSLANPDINNASGTKQTLNGTMNLLVIASDEVSRYYFHNYLDLPSAPPPDIAVLPSAHDYGGLSVGTSVTQQFAVRNLGTRILRVATPALVGPDSTSFVIAAGTDSFVVAAGDSHLVTVGFAPSTAGAMSATLRLASNDPDESPLDVALSGTGITPDIIVQPLSHVFPTLALGDSAAQQFVVRNVGSAILHVTTTWLAGPDSTDFDILGMPPFALAPGDSLDFGIRFAPNTAGSKIATLHIESDDLDAHDVLVQLSGGAVASFLPDLDAPTTILFGAVALGTVDSLTLTLANTGLADLHVTSCVLVGPDSLDFMLLTTGSFTLSPSSTGSIGIVFSPSALGSRYATLRIVSDDPDESPWEIALQGTGGVPDLTVSPASHSFGSVSVRTVATQSFLLTNPGTLTLRVSSITLSGPSAHEFSITSGGSAFDLLPGTSCNLVVAFLPATTGPKSAALMIASNDPETPSSRIALYGNGAPAVAGQSSPMFAENARGSSTGSITVSTTDSLAAGNGQLYLATVSTWDLVSVAAVNGMGLTWSPVLAQCGANRTMGIEVWVGQGTPVPGVVTATFDTAPASAVILVSRYAGADFYVPIVASSSANTAGASGPCAGGTDSPAYTLPFGTSVAGSVVFAAVATGAGVLTPGAGWTLRSTMQTQAIGAACGAAVLDRTAFTSSSLIVDGTLDTAVDWAVVAVEIRPVPATTDAFAEALGTGIDRAALLLHGNGSGRSVQIEIALPRATIVHATLHDVRGQRLRTLWNGALPAGLHELPWAEPPDGPGLATGIYFVRADLGDRILTRKLLLVH